MNQPAGFVLGPTGKVVAVDPSASSSTRRPGTRCRTCSSPAYMVTGFLLASVYAVGMLRGRMDRYVRLGFVIPFAIAAVAAPVQVMVGDVAARGVMADQPAKFAAIELILTTGPRQPETIGGVLVDGEVIGGLAIPVWRRSSPGSRPTR